MRDKIMAMEAGNVLDQLIAEDVMKWKERVDFDIVDGIVARYVPNTMEVREFKPSTDISAAFKVFEWFDFPILEKGHDEEMNDYYICIIGPHRVIESTAPLAICKCALLAVMNP